MKKLILSLGIITIFGGFFTFASANTNCKEVEFGSSIRACVNIEYVSTNRRRLVTTIHGSSTSNLICDIMTPDNGLRSISACNGEFTYNGNAVARIKLRIRHNNVAPSNRQEKPNSGNERLYPQRAYNRGNRRRASDSISPSIIDNFSITTSPSNPRINERTDITIRARNNNTTNNQYRGTVNFRVERRVGSSWTTASSSLYNLASTSYIFSAGDNGQKTFTNFIRFTNQNYDYRLIIYDNSNNNVQGIKTFYFDGNYDDNDDDNYNYSDNFEISSNNNYPNLNQLVNLTIRAKTNTLTNTNYRGSVKFEIRYRQIGTTSWIKTTSLNHYEMRYPYEDNGLSFYASHNGTVTINDFIRFRRQNHEYKVVVIDKNNSNTKGEHMFRVEESGTTNTNNFLLSTNNSSPNIGQRTNLGIRAREGTVTNTNYRGNIEFEVYYKASGSSTRVKTTSATYYNIHSSYRNGYTFSSSQNGNIAIANFIKFNKNNYSYKVLVYDKDNEDIIGEKIFTVGNIENEESNINGFTLSEINTVEAIYDARDNMINNLRTAYPKLRTHTTRSTMSNTLKSDMKDIIDNKSNKKYTTFNTFYNAFVQRYRYTVNVR